MLECALKESMHGTRNRILFLGSTPSYSIIHLITYKKE